MTNSWFKPSPPPRSPAPEDLPVGQRIYLQGPGGQPIPALVVEVTDETVTFDLNHEMAGKDLNFEIALVADRSVE